MKNLLKLPLLAFFLFFIFRQATPHAQTAVSLDPEFGARLSASVDKKLAKGLHLNLEEEIRFDNNFKSFNRFHTTLDLTYKLNSNIKLGVGYSMINPYDSDNGAFKSSRHRLMVDATGGLRFGDWRLSLKERFQATVRTGDMNLYQNPRTAFALKSRLKLQYKGWRSIEPYAYVELRNTLNAPVVKANFDGTYYLTESLSRYGEAGWFLDGFTGVYVNRLRGCIGASFKFDRRSSIDVSVLADHVSDKVVDANAAGTKLKSYTLEEGFAGFLTVSYKYAF